MIKRGGVFPASYWANTSSNSVVRDLVEQIDDEEGELKEELEYLMNGGTIEKPIHEDITYDVIYDFQENLWNFLFFTGYLKKVAVHKKGRKTMSISNDEVAYIYENTISGWFEKKKRFELSSLYKAIEEGDTEGME